MNVYTVLIVGAGKIGAFFDTPQSAAVLTHAHAFTSHPGFRLAGFVDSDRKQSECAVAIWGGEAFSSVASACAGGGIDVVVVAAPDEFHYPLLKEIAGYPVRLVFAEKPLTRTVVEAEEIITIFRKQGICLTLNYSRRFVPEFISLRNDIASGLHGRFLAGTGYYGKGILHNGSHMIDLFRFMVGNIAKSGGVSRYRDHYKHDPSCTAMLFTDEGGCFFMHAVDSRCYTIFEMDLLFERKRMRIIDSGFAIEISEVLESPMFAGYRNMSPVEMRETGLKNALMFAAAHIHEQLSSGAKPWCDGMDGLIVQQVCADIHETYLE